MSQHDYVLDNALGASIRTDINAALAAIVSNNAGATEPATMYAFQWWADTTANILKRRNAGNTAWIDVMKLDGSAMAGSFTTLTASSLTTSMTDTTTTATTVVLNGNTLTVAPTSNTQATHIGVLGDVIFTGAANDVDPGHPIGVFGFARMNSAGHTLNLAIGVEGKATVLAGDVNYLISTHSGLESIAVGSTVTAWVGNHQSINSLAGTCTYAVANAFGPTSISGTVENVIGLYMFPPFLGAADGAVNGTGAVTNMILAHMPDISGTLTVTNTLAFSSKLNYVALKNRWHMWFDGTAPSYMGGNFLLGTKTFSESIAMRVAGSLTAGASQTGLSITSTASSASTSYASGGHSALTLGNGSGVTYAQVFGWDAGAITKSGASDVVTQYSAFHAANQTATIATAAGFHGEMASGANRWNLYMSGTAVNYLAGALLIGTTTNDGVNALQVNGSAKAQGFVQSAAATGYNSGAASGLVRLSGGTPDDGAVLLMGGSTHATIPNIGGGLIGTTNIWQWDINGMNLSAGKVLKAGGTQVISARQTGWAAATGTATRTTFDTATVTLPQLAERVKAALDDLGAHGLIGA